MRFERIIRDHFRGDHLLGLSGSNFSGRSSVLRTMTGLPATEQDDDLTQVLSDATGIYIGPEIYNSISGLTSSVETELALHGLHADDTVLDEFLRDELRFDRLRDHVPGLLSGGEQACLAIVTACICRPSLLAIDCAMEQLDDSLRTALVSGIREKILLPDRTMIADNEVESLSDLRVVPVSMLSPELRTHEHRFGPLRVFSQTELQAVRPASVSLRKVVFGYRKTAPVIKAVEYDFEPGRIYILEGANGSGKSTLAKLLCGVLRPHGGAIYQDGTAVDLAKSFRGLFAYHFQNPDVQLFSDSVWQEIQPAHRMPGRSPVDGSATEMLIEAFGLSQVVQDNPLDLPFVMRKRVGLASTLAMGTPWLILDEPSLGQDAESVEMLAAMIEQLAKTGRGVMVISHSKRLKGRLRGITVRLDEGKLS